MVCHWYHMLVMVYKYFLQFQFKFLSNPQRKCLWRFDCKGSKQLTSTLTRSSPNFSSWISARSCSINRSLHRHRHHQSLLTGHSLPTHPLPQDTVLNLETHWKALLHLNLLIPQISKEQRFGFLLLFLCVCVCVCVCEHARTHMHVRAWTHVCVHVLAVTHITYTFDSDYTYAMPKLQDAQQPEPEDYP